MFHMTRKNLRKQKTALTFSTLKLSSHVQVVQGRPDELQGLVQGVSVARAGVEDVNTLSKGNSKTLEFENQSNLIVFKESVTHTLNKIKTQKGMYTQNHNVFFFVSLPTFVF